MKHSVRLALIAAALSTAAFAYQDLALQAQATHLEPKSARPGAVLTVTGSALDKKHIEEVYLTDHRFDMMVKVLEQTEDTLKIRIPPFAKPGRLQLLLLTSGPHQVYLEQPLYVQIEDADAPAPVISKNGKPVEVASSKPETLSLPSAKPDYKSAVLAAAQAKPKSARPEPKAPPVEKAAPVETAQVRPQPVPAVTPAQTPSVPAETPAAVAPKPQPQITQTAPSEMIPARVLRRTAISYPASAPTGRMETTVELQAEVGADGQVKDVKFVKGNLFFGKSAMTSVRNWLYEPARINGKPVPSTVSIILNFKPQL